MTKRYLFSTFLLVMLLLPLAVTAQEQQGQEQEQGGEPSTDEMLGEENTFWETWRDFILAVPGHLPIDTAMDKMKEIDPLEPLNRKIFAFNDFGDRYFLTPVAKTYLWLTPDLAEKGVSNVFSNLFIEPRVFFFIDDYSP